VTWALENIMEWRGCPKEICCDNGPEYVRGALQSWAREKGIRIVYIQPGKPHLLVSTCGAFYFMIALKNKITPILNLGCP
jgi:transposase InsO family protein